eukprot:3172591-Rhodomonas_salina.1
MSVTTRPPSPSRTIAGPWQPERWSEQADEECHGNDRQHPNRMRRRLRVRPVPSCLHISTALATSTPPPQSLMIMRQTAQSALVSSRIITRASPS